MNCDERKIYIFVVCYSIGGGLMTKVIKVNKDNLTDKEIADVVRKKVNSITEEERFDIFMTDLLEAIEKPNDLVCVWTFFKFLVGKDKDKVFVTVSETPVAKHKKVLEELHNVRIKIIKAKVKKSGNKKTDNNKSDENKKPFYCT